MSPFTAFANDNNLPLTSNAYVKRVAQKAVDQKNKEFWSQKKFWSRGSIFAVCLILICVTASFLTPVEMFPYLFIVVLVVFVFLTVHYIKHREKQGGPWEIEIVPCSVDTTSLSEAIDKNSDRKVMMMKFLESNVKAKFDMVRVTNYGNDEILESVIVAIVAISERENLVLWLQGDL